MTYPVPTETVRVSICANVATILALAVRGSTHGSVPLQLSPDQPAKYQPGPGSSVSITKVFREKF